LKAKQDAGELKKKKAAREEDARPDLEYGLGGGVPHSLSSSGRRSELDEEIFTRPPFTAATVINAYQLCKDVDAQEKGRFANTENARKPAFLKNGL
jgi:hypothetical protein